MEKASREPLWTRSYVMTILIFIFVFIPYSLTQSIFPMYVIKGLNGSTQLAGLSNTIFSVACILCRVHTSRLERAIGISRTVKISCFLFLLTFILFLTTKNITVVLCLRFLCGACYAIANTALMSIGIQFIPASRKSEGIAYLMTVAMLGWAIGPFIGVNILQYWSYKGMFLFCSLAFLPFLLLFYFIDMSGLKRAAADSDRKAQGFSIHNYVAVGILPIGCAALLLTGAYSSVVSFVAAYANSINLFIVSSYYFLLLATFAVVTRLLSGRISRLTGENALIFSSYAVLSAGLFLLGLARTAFVMLASGILIGIATGFITPCLQAIAVRSAPARRVSVITATFMTMMDLGSGLGAYTTGACIPTLGYSNIYLGLSPVMLCIPGLFFWIYIRKERLKERGIASSAPAP